MAVAEIGNTNTASEVEVFASAHHRDVAAGAALDDLIGETTDTFGNMPRAELCELGDRHDDKGLMSELWESMAEAVGLKDW